MKSYPMRMDKLVFLFPTCIPFFLSLLFWLESQVLYLTKWQMKYSNQRLGRTLTLFVPNFRRL